MVQVQEPAVRKQEYLMFSLLLRILSHEGQVTKMFIFLLLCVSVQSGTASAGKTSGSLVQGSSVW